MSVNDSVKRRFRYDWCGCGFKAVTDEFLGKVCRICDELGASPDDLMTVMAFESGLDHRAVNRSSGASGLIQFMPSTAESLGTTTEALRAMSALEQLDYVKKYFLQSGIDENAHLLGDLYMAVLWPRAVGKPDDYVLFSRGSVQYENNRGLDYDGDGFITKADALQVVLKNRKGYVGS